MSMNPVKVFNSTLTIIVSLALISAGFWVHHWIEEGRILRQVIERLSAESRIAEILVTKSEYSEESKRILTTIKFLEFDTQGEPLKPKYFSFQGNIIQFQSLVIRFNDSLVKAGDKIRGKSAYLFTKAFVLDEDNTQIFNITESKSIPQGYKIAGLNSDYEKELWEDFWTYALDPHVRDRAGIKNAQIEAPGTIFLPGTIYTLYIEHDGGIRIDAQPVPAVLKGEQL